jgi:signal transduction histidine kinase
MHDVLAHRLSVLALHAGALQRRAADLPAPLADRVDVLRATSTDALRDLRDVLGSSATRARPGRELSLRPRTSSLSCWTRRAEPVGSSTP